MIHIEYLKYWTILSLAAKRRTTQSTREIAGGKTQSWAGGLPILFEKIDETLLLLIEAAVLMLGNNLHAITQVIAIPMIRNWL